MVLPSPPQNGWPSPNLGPAVNDSSGSSSAAQLPPLRQPAGLLSVAVHPPSALPGQPPNGETPASIPPPLSPQGERVCQVTFLLLALSPQVSPHCG